MSACPGDSVFVEVHDGAGIPRVIRAFATLTPGLVVHESLGDAGWIITHERSGLLVAIVDDPEAAQALAAAFGIVDWTRTGVELQADPARLDILAIRDEFGADGSPNRPELKPIIEKLVSR